MAKRYGRRLTGVAATGVASQQAGAKMTPEEYKKFLIRLMHKQYKEARECKGAVARCEVCKLTFAVGYVKLCVAPVAFHEPMMVCGRCRYEAGKGKYPIAK